MSIKRVEPSSLARVATTGSASRVAVIDVLRFLLLLVVVGRVLVLLEFVLHLM